MRISYNYDIIQNRPHDNFCITGELMPSLLASLSNIGSSISRYFKKNIVLSLLPDYYDGAQKVEWAKSDLYFAQSILMDPNQRDNLSAAHKVELLKIISTSNPRGEFRAEYNNWFWHKLEYYMSLENDADKYFPPYPLLADSPENAEKLLELGLLNLKVPPTNQEGRIRITERARPFIVSGPQKVTLAIQSEKLAEEIYLQSDNTGEENRNIEWQGIRYNLTAPQRAEIISHYYPQQNGVVLPAESSFWKLLLNSFAGANSNANYNALPREQKLDYLNDNADQKTQAQLNVCLYVLKNSATATAFLNNHSDEVMNYLTSQQNFRERFFTMITGVPAQERPADGNLKAAAIGLLSNHLRNLNADNNYSTIFILFSRLSRLLTAEARKDLAAHLCGKFTDNKKLALLLSNAADREALESLLSAAEIEYKPALDQHNETSLFQNPALLQKYVKGEDIINYVATKDPTFIAKYWNTILSVIKNNKDAAKAFVANQKLCAHLEENQIELIPFHFTNLESISAFFKLKLSLFIYEIKFATETDFQLATKIFSFSREANWKDRHYLVFTNDASKKIVEKIYELNGIKTTWSKANHHTDRSPFTGDMLAGLKCSSADPRNVNLFVPEIATLAAIHKPTFDPNAEQNSAFAQLFSKMKNLLKSIFSLKINIGKEKIDTELFKKKIRSVKGAEYFDYEVVDDSVQLSHEDDSQEVNQVRTTGNKVIDELNAQMTASTSLGSAKKPAPQSQIKESADPSNSPHSKAVASTPDKNKGLGLQADDEQATHSSPPRSDGKTPAQGDSTPAPLTASTNSGTPLSPTSASSTASPAGPKNPSPPKSKDKNDLPENASVEAIIAYLKHHNDSDNAVTLAFTQMMIKIINKDKKAQTVTPDELLKLLNHFKTKPNIIAQFLKMVLKENAGLITAVYNTTVSLTSLGSKHGNDLIRLAASADEEFLLHLLDVKELFAISDKCLKKRAVDQIKTFLMNVWNKKASRDNIIKHLINRKKFFALNSDADLSIKLLENNEYNAFSEECIKKTTIQDIKKLLLTHWDNEAARNNIVAILAKYKKTSSFNLTASDFELAMKLFSDSAILKQLLPENSIIKTALLFDSEFVSHHFGKLLDIALHNDKEDFRALVQKHKLTANDINQLHGGFMTTEINCPSPQSMAELFNNNLIQKSEFIVAKLEMPYSKKEAALQYLQCTEDQLDNSAIIFSNKIMFEVVLKKLELQPSDVKIVFQNFPIKLEEDTGMGFAEAKSTQQKQPLKIIDTVKVEDAFSKFISIPARFLLPFPDVRRFALLDDQVEKLNFANDSSSNTSSKSFYDTKSADTRSKFSSVLQLSSTICNQILSLVKTFNVFSNQRDQLEKYFRGEIHSMDGWSPENRKIDFNESAESRALRAKAGSPFDAIEILNNEHRFKNRKKALISNKDLLEIWNQYLGGAYFDWAIKNQLTRTYDITYDISYFQLLTWQLDQMECNYENPKLDENTFKLITNCADGLKRCELLSIDDLKRLIDLMIHKIKSTGIIDLIVSLQQLAKKDEDFAPLELNEKTSCNDIQSAYRQLALTFHSDKQGQNNDSETLKIAKNALGDDAFKIISETVNILKEIYGLKEKYFQVKANNVKHPSDVVHAPAPHLSAFGSSRRSDNHKPAAAAASSEPNDWEKAAENEKKKGESVSKPTVFTGFS